MSTPAERFRENITGIVSTLVTGIWLAALFLNFEWWLPFMLFGYIVIVPITAMVFGEEDEESEYTTDYADQARSDDAATSRDSAATDSNEDALQTLRDRYARGELTDEQFERKLERLLETETLEDAEDRARGVKNDELETERE
jgi:uncharacterized membrane protein